MRVPLEVKRRCFNGRDNGWIVACTDCFQNFTSISRNNDRHFLQTSFRVQIDTSRPCAENCLLVVISKLEHIPIAFTKIGCIPSLSKELTQEHYLDGGAVAKDVFVVAG